MDADSLYVLAGLGVGLAVGVTGMGGGALMTPLLVLGFGVGTAVAVGTDLVFAAITKCGGVWIYRRRGLIRWPLVGALLMGSLPTAAASLLLLGENPLGAAQETLLRSVLGVALLLSSLAMLFRNRLRASGEWREHSKPPVWRGRATILTGAVLGVLVTLTSVGAGALGTAALICLYPRLKTAEVIGTDLAHAVILAAVAGLGHMQLGTVDYGLLGLLLLGSVPGVLLGSQLATRLPEQVVRPVVATALFVVGTQLLV